MAPLPIIDSFGRAHNSLRISVTDRCNIRCTYCMPETVRFLPRQDLLTFEEIARLVRLLAKLGVNKIRLTGGEPLMRAELWRLVEYLNAIEGIDEIALTTNGILLADQAQALKNAGLHRINVSLDTVNAETFEKLTRRSGLEKVIAGIAATQSVGFHKLRLNAISMKGLTETEIIPLAHFARENQLHLRFIEFMPLDADHAWEQNKVLTGREVQRLISAEIGPLEPILSGDPSQPAVDFQYADGRGKVGFINSVSEPFCETCNRMRLSAEGGFRNCLFSDREWDLRELLRGGADDAQIEYRIRECISAKMAGHGSDTYAFRRPEKTMHQIGG